MRIWTYKNVNEKAHTFSRTIKNEKKTDEKRILCTFAYRLQARINSYSEVIARGRSPLFNIQRPEIKKQKVDCWHSQVVSKNK